MLLKVSCASITWGGIDCLEGADIKEEIVANLLKFSLPATKHHSHNMALRILRCLDIFHHPGVNGPQWPSTFIDQILFEHVFLVDEGRGQGPHPMLHFEIAKLLLGSHSEHQGGWSQSHILQTLLGWSAALKAL